MSAKEETLKNIFELIINNSKSHAQSLVSDEAMNQKEYEEEKSKAKDILKGSIATILTNCNLYGTDSIYQADENKLEIETFFTELIREIGEETFNIKY